ncbi:hypothetical protein OYC64_009317 [Pagothenia borchgrevinki]|uniref:Uncharacterized protein n=1 Tax=Pagothenia borchgrevinki TaxID=8213 RepID=A0ABD2H530_PAGBO
MNVTADVNPGFVLLKQRYCTEASLQHGHLRDPPPGGLPQPVGGDGKQQLRPHQRRRQGLREAEEKRSDVRLQHLQGNVVEPRQENTRKKP